MKVSKPILWIAACAWLTGGAGLLAAEFGGPTEMQDTFLPSELRYQSYPESARVLPVNKWSANATWDWTSHLARTDTFLFDGETLTSTLKVRHSPIENWEFGFDAPYTSRSGGMLDEFIEDVEKVTGKVQARFDLPRDKFNAFIMRDGRTVLRMHTGSGFNDLTLRAKYQFLHANDDGHWDGAVVTTLSLPTGNDTFGGDGVSPGLGLHFQRPFREFNFFCGAAANYYSDAQEQQFHFNDLRGMGYFGGEWAPLRWFELVGTFQVYSPFASSQHPLNDPSYYYSITGRFRLPWNFVFETGVVENLGIIENRNSSDVTFKFSLTYLF